MRVFLALLILPFAVFQVGCSSMTWRTHQVTLVTLPKHPLPPEASTYRLIIEGESLLEPRLAAGITVPGLERTACEQRTDVRVTVQKPGGTVTLERNASRADKKAPTEDVVVTVGIGFADSSALSVKERTSEDKVSGQADRPHPVYAYEGSWLVPQKLVVATTAHGEIENLTEPARAPLFFERDLRTKAPFLARGTLQRAWKEASPGLAMRVTQDSVADYIARANRIIEDDFLLRSTTIAIGLVDEYKMDARFAEASRSFASALATRLADPTGFAAKIEVPMRVWTAIAERPAAADDRTAIAAARYNLAVGKLAVDRLDEAEGLALAAQTHGIEAVRIEQLKTCIADRRKHLAAIKR
ncbi:MAG: hypothetical protein H0V44_08170 [Planctomycetes bacterium]|nr:hypothetical protein [Planctomycetota bacterium]